MSSLCSKKSTFHTDGAVKETTHRDLIILMKSKSAGTGYFSSGSYPVNNKLCIYPFCRTHNSQIRSGLFITFHCMLNRINQQIILLKELEQMLKQHNQNHLSVIGLRKLV
jgi:hypothetical protein